MTVRTTKTRTAASHEDGRRARSQRTRQAVIDAALALSYEGVGAPTVEQISGRAGVSRRIVFDRFGDRVGIFEAALLQLHAEILSGAPAHPAELRLDSRIAAFVQRRSGMLERIHPVVRSGGLEDNPAAASARLQALHATLAAEVTTAFMPEIAAAPAGSRRTVAAALVAAAGLGSWQGYRLHQGLSARQARAAMSTSLVSLTGPSHYADAV